MGQIQDLTWEAAKVLSKKLGIPLVAPNDLHYIKKEDAYFACTDFITSDGTDKYDVDFWMKKGADGKLDVYMTKIHKKNDMPRFVYKDDEIADVE